MASVVGKNYLAAVGARGRGPHPRFRRIVGRHQPSGGRILCHRAPTRPGRPRRGSRRRCWSLDPAIVFVPASQPIRKRRHTHTFYCAKCMRFIAQNVCVLLRKMYAFYCAKCMRLPCIVAAVPPVPISLCYAGRACGEAARALADRCLSLSVLLPTLYLLPTSQNPSHDCCFAVSPHAQLLIQLGSPFPSTHNVAAPIMRIQS